MKIGIDARVAKLNLGSGLGKYTNQIIEHFKYIDKVNKYYLFLPQNDYKDMYRTVDENNGESKSNIWKQLGNTPCKDQPPVDVFHNTINGIGIPKKGNHKLVITVHDLIPYVIPEAVDKYYLDYVLKHTPEVVDQADKIITVSHHSKKDIKRYFQVPDEKVKVIHHAVDDAFQPINKRLAKKYIAERYNIKGKFILFGGGFSSRKNSARLIRAFNLICNEFEKQIKLVIMGKPAHNYEDLIKLANKLSLDDKIIFTGPISTKDLPFFYNSCEAFVYPSLYEGFPAAPLEAASCATPVIASNVSSIPEIMGDSCTYVNPNNVINIAQGIYDTVYDQELRRSLSEKALIQSKKFSWLKTSKETLEVYKETLK